MIIKYKFVNNEELEIEVSGELEAVILEIDDKTQKSDRRETRRHQSLDKFKDKSDVFIDTSVFVEDDALGHLEVERLRKAILKLKPSEQELLHKLYLDKQLTSQAEYAKNSNLNEVTIWKKAQRIRDKLRKLM